MSCLHLQCGRFFLSGVKTNCKCDDYANDSPYSGLLIGLIKIPISLFNIF